MNKSSSIIALGGIVAVTILSIFLITGLRFEYDFEAFFPQHDPSTDFYMDFRERFETDNDFFIIVLENENGIFDAPFLARVDSLAENLKGVNEIVEVLSPTQLTEFSRDPFIGTVFERPLLRWNEPEYLNQDSSLIYSRDGLVGIFFSEDGKSLAINMKHTERLSKEKCDVLSDQITSLVSSYQWDKAHVIGRALGQKVLVELMIKELTIFISLSLLITVIFLFIAFRSGWGIVIPTLVVLIAILWTLGFMRIIGKNMDLMLTILPTIIFVVGMSDSVHVLTKYMQELRNGRDKVDAIRYAFKSIRLATFLTALTTSIGFLTLVLSDIKPISDFGIYTSVGVMLAYALTFTMLPAILFLAKPKRLYEFSTNEDFWSAKLQRLFLFILRNKRAVFITGIVILATGVLGISMIKVDNVMLEDLRDDHLLKQEFRFIETHYAGVRPFEMSITINEGKHWYDEDVLRGIDSIDVLLHSLYVD
ncbi:MAG: efflux RND transporter permease subunit [Flavobacteriales bacterium]